MNKFKSMDHFEDVEFLKKVSTEKEFNEDMKFNDNEIPIEDVIIFLKDNKNEK